MIETIFVSTPWEDAPEDDWWCPYYMIVTDGDKLLAGGGVWDYPQDDPQAVKDGGIISSDWLFCPDFEFCD